MGAHLRQRFMTVAVLFGVIGSALLLSAYRGNVAEIFSSQDRRFVLLVLTVAAVASALTSRAVGFLLGVAALIAVLTLSYPSGQVDLVALRWAAVLLLAFDLTLGAQLWFDRERS